MTSTYSGSKGPLLLPGPVEIDLADGGTARSERTVVAVCTCKRSRRLPWCDTSHRRRVRVDSAAVEEGR